MGTSTLRHIDVRILGALFVAWLITWATAAWIVSLLNPTISPVPSGGYTQTTGIVQATFPSQHDTVRYSYAVNGEIFEATWFADGPEGHADSLKIGQQITVWYETNNPARSCSCSDPHVLQRTSNDPTLDDLALFVLITALFLGIGSRVLLGGWLEFIDLARSISSGNPPEPPEGRYWG